MKNDCLTSSFMALREKLHRSALGLLRNDEDARDALQDTFFRLWGNGGDMKSDAEARNKLFAVLRNRCIDMLRRPRTVGLPEEATAGMSVMPDSGEDLEKLEALMTRGLTQVQRRVYELVVHDGEEYEDIASMLGMSVDAVRMNMSRARRKIRENYKQLDR